MATPGMIPTFVTGANARIKVDGITFAYAQDVSYSIAVDVIPIETMGRYEAAAQEPVNYAVGGDLAIVRYTKAAITNANNNGTAPKGTNANGNGIGNVQGGLTGQNMSGHLNPGQILLSKTWDLDVFQKKQDSSGNISVDESIIKVRDCRFTRMSGGLSKRGILVDRFSFVGILGGDDSFDASNSGDDDLSI
jgi:hypothetical protein